MFLTMHRQVNRLELGGKRRRSPVRFVCDSAKANFTV